MASSRYWESHLAVNSMERGAMNVKETDSEYRAALVAVRRSLRQRGVRCEGPADPVTGEFPFGDPKATPWVEKSNKARGTKYNIGGEVVLRFGKGSSRGSTEGFAVVERRERDWRYYRARAIIRKRKLSLRADLQTPFRYDRRLRKWMWIGE